MYPSCITCSSGMLRMPWAHVCHIFSSSADDSIFRKQGESHFRSHWIAPEFLVESISVGHTVGILFRTNGNSYYLKIHMWKQSKTSAVRIPSAYIKVTNRRRRKKHRSDGDTVLAWMVNSETRRYFFCPNNEASAELGVEKSCPPRRPGTKQIIGLLTKAFGCNSGEIKTNYFDGCCF